jgi:hypothetical protein
MKHAHDKPILSSVSLTGAAMAAAGALFCAVAGLGGAESLCLTEGCSLYKDVVLAGISLWWYGAACFALVTGLAVAGLGAWAFALSLAGLLGDCFFLLWMAVSSPCANCLIAGAFFFLTLLALLPVARAPLIKKCALTVAGLWLFLFSPNLFEVGRELLAPWPMHGAADAPIKFFYSPSCPACREAHADMLPRGKNVAFFPVAEDKKDLGTLARLEAALAQGKEYEAAYQEALAASGDAPSASLGLQARLWRNQLALARMSARTLPVTFVQGYPKTKPAPAAKPGMTLRDPQGDNSLGLGPGLNPTTPDQPSVPGESPAGLPPGQGNFRGCSPSTPANCD